MTSVRKVYQKAIVIPTHHVEQLWKEYESFENSVSRALVIIWHDNSEAFIFKLIWFYPHSSLLSTIETVTRYLCTYRFLFVKINSSCLPKITVEYTFFAKWPFFSRQKVYYLSINQSLIALKLCIESERNTLMILIGTCLPFPQLVLPRYIFLLQ